MLIPEKYTKFKTESLLALSYLSVHTHWAVELDVSKLKCKEELCVTVNTDSVNRQRCNGCSGKQPDLLLFFPFLSFPSLSLLFHLPSLLHSVPLSAFHKPSFSFPFHLLASPLLFLSSSPFLFPFPCLPFILPQPPLFFPLLSSLSVFYVIFPLLLSSCLIFSPLSPLPIHSSSLLHSPGPFLSSLSPLYSPSSSPSLLSLLLLSPLSPSSSLSSFLSLRSASWCPRVCV